MKPSTDMSFEFVINTYSYCIFFLPHKLLYTGFYFIWMDQFILFMKSWTRKHILQRSKRKMGLFLCQYSINKCAYGRNANPFQILVKQIYVFVYLLKEKALLFLQAR